jgi:hypothetical protein
MSPDKQKSGNQVKQQMDSDICSSENKSRRKLARKEFSTNTQIKKTKSNDISYPKFLENKFDHPPKSSNINTIETQKSTENPSKSLFFIKFKVKKSHFNHCKNHPNLPIINNLC